MHNLRSNNSLMALLAHQNALMLLFLLLQTSEMDNPNNKLQIYVHITIKVTDREQYIFLKMAIPHR